MSRGDDLHFCHTSAVISTFLNLHFPECCCGSRKSSLCVVRPGCPSSLEANNLAVVPAILKMRDLAISLRPLLSSTLSKNVGNYSHSWSSHFLFLRVRIDCHSKTSVIVSILGVPPFWLDGLILRIFIFPQEILKFWSVDGFDAFVSFSELLYYQWKHTLFGALMNSSFSTIFRFCYTSLPIFNILMLIFDNLNISKDQ